MKASRPVVAIIGSGFGGSLLALALQARGLQAVLLERGRHPRFAIGESTTPLTNLLLEEIADEFGLPQVRPLSKWGTWQRERPELPCGLKRGFTFYRHELGKLFPREREESLRRQLMVGASPDPKVADTHWYRPEFDRFLVEQAREAGADYRDDCDIESIREEPRRICVVGRRGGHRFDLAADFLVDASGPRGCLHRLLRLGEKGAAGFPRTQALYAHFAGVDALDERFVPGAPPYPGEQAAVHHLFDGGWVWVLKFNHGLTSAGVVATAPAARRIGLRPGEAGWKRLLTALPSVGRAFARSRAVTPFYWQPQVAFQAGRVRGRRWALLPSAAGVIDPLLSTGFPLTLMGVQRLARLLASMGQRGFDRELERYARTTTREFEATAVLVKALYRHLPRFDDFRELSLAYFAAAGFSEASRRLGRGSEEVGFLLQGNRRFGRSLREVCAPRLQGKRLKSAVRRAIEPFDVLGLCDDARSPWYPARMQDLLLGANKLGASEAEIASMLRRCGLHDQLASAP